MPVEANDLLKEKLTESLTEIESWLHGTKGFVLEQAPLVVTEVLRWEIYNSLFFIGFGLFISSICFIIAYILYRHSKTADGTNGYGGQPSDKGCLLILHWIAIVCNLVPILMISLNLHHLIYVWCAPRVFLIEKVSELLK